MNTKHLIIAFITVSVAALIVSAFAVFAAARSQYAAILASVSEAEDIRTDEATQAPEPTDSPETSTAPETSAAPETTAEISESETFTLTGGSRVKSVRFFVLNANYVPEELPDTVTIR